MRIAICAAAVVAAGCAAGACAAGISVPGGFSASATGWNFMGGFDYLPNGDIIGMHADPLLAENSWIGVADANGDGIPASVEKVYDFGMAEWAGFVKVSPRGTTAVFCESTNYKLYAMDLDNNYSVQEIIPDGGTFDGAFDLAFAGETSCYVSANPGWSKTNEILHLDIVTGKVKKVASIPDTYSGPVDTDDEGNLYYVSGKAHYPVEKGDFTLLKFDAAKLAEALEDGRVLARGDATTVAMGLDGGYDVAWHASSGDLFVSDCNHGTIVRIPAEGVPAEFASLPGEDGEGFRVVAFFDGGKAFARGERSGCTLATDYLPIAGNQGLDVYRISPPPPFVNAVVSSKRPAAGSRLALTVTAQPQGTRFDGYIVLLGPGGAAYSVTGRGLVPGVAPYVSAVRGLATVFKERVLDMTVPSGAAEGKWKIYAGLMRAGAKPDTGAALALDELEVEVVGK
jgi:hypothetical protein